MILRGHESEDGSYTIRNQTANEHGFACRCGLANSCAGLVSRRFGCMRARRQPKRDGAAISKRRSSGARLSGLIGIPGKFCDSMVLYCVLRQRQRRVRLGRDFDLHRGRHR